MSDDAKMLTIKWMGGFIAAIILALWGWTLFETFETSRRVAVVETKVDGLEVKFDKLETKVDNLSLRMTSVESKLDILISHLIGGDREEDAPADAGNLSLEN
ncbi:MAG: hypothetical protein OXU65_01730 [Deltaproteobacteria bacterium]|nr:hypothetical protein [Deltaproteobacteria bacterium]